MRIHFVDNGGPVILTIYNINCKTLYNSKFENAESSIYILSISHGLVIDQIEKIGVILRKHHP